jgi:hypothetical protein
MPTGETRSDLGVWRELSHGDLGGLGEIAFRRGAGAADGLDPGSDCLLVEPEDLG